MVKLKWILGLTCLCLFYTATGSPAQQAEAVQAHPALPQEASVTNHTATIEGKTVGYTATAGTLPLTDKEGKVLANMFFIAYTRGDVGDARKRPLLFSFNGGPGAASVWMHIGLLGPRKVSLDENGFRFKPPHQLVNNDHSILDLTDIVFIDPVSTGYSRTVPGVDPGRFHGYREDLESVGEFIRLYLTRYNRWESPKFVIGESYGSRRAAGLSLYLESELGIDPSGIILVSAGSIGEEYGRFGILEYALNLPHFAATAWYHKKLAPDLQSKPLRDLLDEVEAFALGDYALALLKGNRLAGQEKTDMVRRVSRYTGLSEAYVESANTRITLTRFRKELLRRENRHVGRLDSRFAGVDTDPPAENPGFDPAMVEIQASFTATINNYIRNDLGYKTDLNYEISADVRPWKPAPDLNLLESLRSAMAQNRNLRVLVADGYYDKLYFWPAFTFSQFDFNPEIRERITIATYESGHMMYIHGPSLVKMKGDIAEFIRAATGE